VDRCCDDVIVSRAKDYGPGQRVVLAIFVRYNALILL
jgi:hypothetical protein